MSTPTTIAIAIIAVLAATAALGWTMWRVVRSAERMERDPKYLRRRLIWVAVIYVFGTVFGIIEVATGQQPIQSLIGLPIVLAMIWFFLRSASKVKVPRD